MSIQTEITRISGNVSDALDAIAAKGVTIPSGSNSDDMATLIGQISTGTPVNVEGNRTAYVGGGVTVVTPSSGYDAMAKVTTVVQSGTLATPAINSSTGVVTAQVYTRGYIESGASTAKTLQLPTQAAQTIIPTTTDQTIASGLYLTGVQTIKGISFSTIRTGSGAPSSSLGVDGDIYIQTS